MQLDPAGGLASVPALDGVADHGGQLGAVGADDERGGVLQPALQPGPQILVVEQRTTEALHRPDGAALQFRGLGGERGVQGGPHGGPQADQGLGRLRMAEQPLLEPLGPLGHHRVVLQVVGDLAQQVVEGGPGGMVAIAPDRPQPLHRLVVGPADHPPADEPGRPAGGPLADDAVEGVRVPAQPVVHLADHQVDQPVMRAVADDRVQQVAHRPRQRFGLQPGHDHVGDQVVHVVVLDVGQRHPRQPGALGHRPGRVGVHLQPLTQPDADAGGGDPLADDVLGEEVLAEERLQVAGDVVLALRDDRGVRDRQPERMPEQGGDREPVGQGADHRRLGAGVHEAPDARIGHAQGGQVDDRGGHQQRQRDQLHPAQPGRPFLVGLRQGCDRHPLRMPGPRRPDAARAGGPAARLPRAARSVRRAGGPGLS